MTGIRLASASRVSTGLTASLIAATVLCTPVQSHAQGQGPSLVRDTEIENTIRVYCAPLFRAAGLDVGAVRIHLVSDDRLNAFVAGGMQMFIHTGLITRTEHPGQVIGVLAHEIGHLSGGHLSRLREGMRGATAQSILVTILGGAAAIAAGRPDGLAAAIAGGQEVGQRSFFAYTRGMEQAADQAAVNFLDETKQSSRGLLETMEILRSLEIGTSDNPYLQSHPLTSDRIQFLENHVRDSPHAEAPIPPEYIQAYKRARGKIRGFLDPPSRTLANYKADDMDIEARYARAIAYMRQNEPDRGLAIIDALIEGSPQDPFFHELRGDILRDAGRMSEAAESYRRAVAILPWAALIRISLAQTELQSESGPPMESVVANLKEAIRYEPQVPRAWRLLATAYGRMEDKPGLVAHALAEEAILRGDMNGAIGLAQRAMRMLPEGSPEWLRAQDLDIQAKRDRERARNQ